MVPRSGMDGKSLTWTPATFQPPPDGTNSWRSVCTA
ncbi:hypothetical protein HD596_009596 [Nonomuraea jabiensis]|uniref:Uncharacterized protein n=1 Tax=Nonomuraea jabiensis TaxID=882448 RepID=A0A7W9GFF5_9ACTN|nr:hypothetical protein [Nonomuraea jabiensis]